MRASAPPAPRLVQWLIAALACGGICGAALGQEVEPADPAVSTGPRYRVELLVFRHLDSTEEGSTETELRDFSNALDLLTPPETEEETGEPEEPIPPSVLHEGDATQAVREEGITAEVVPPAVLIEMQSEAMQHAWRRLRGSANFRPEQFMAWEQSMDQPPPFIRVHDLTVLEEVDLLAEISDGEADDGDPATVFNDTTHQPDIPAGEADESGDDDGTDPEILKPQIVRYYRIDGISRLRRSRFLHLDLDLELREPAGQAAGLADDMFTEEKQAYTVYKLSQSRQVQTTKYEYFDGETLSVLALITRINPTPAEVPPAETPPLGEVPESQP